MAKSREKQAAELAAKLGMLRPRDLAAVGIPRYVLYRLVEKGELLRTGRGLYVLADADVTAEHSLAEASKRVPKGTVCLLSALAFHDLTTVSPHEVWMAIPAKARQPKVSRPRIRFVRFSGDALTEGVETHEVERVPVKVYSPAKTVADCFKYRRKIGLDIAMQALRDAWRRKRATVDELWECARICRVANVMRPYLESVVS
ncbi:MAG: type IV toxin-antitoxin system AbiEi family antitoxin domain-containing protein [Planctomycetota bacterium]|jgi:predicted transcriptional regulator of viral defense system